MIIDKPYASPPHSLLTGEDSFDAWYLDVLRLYGVSCAAYAGLDLRKDGESKGFDGSPQRSGIGLSSAWEKSPTVTRGQRRLRSGVHRPSKSNTLGDGHHKERHAEGDGYVATSQGVRSRSSSMPLPLEPSLSAFPSLSEHSERDIQPEEEQQGSDEMGTSALSVPFHTTAAGLPAQSSFNQYGYHFPGPSEASTLNWSSPPPEGSIGQAITTADNKAVRERRLDPLSGRIIGQALTTDGKDGVQLWAESTSSGSTVNETGMPTSSQEGMSRRRKHRAYTVMPSPTSTEQPGGEGFALHNWRDGQMTEACKLENMDLSKSSDAPDVSWTSQNNMSTPPTPAGAAQPHHLSAGDPADPVITASRCRKFLGWFDGRPRVGTLVGFGAGDDKDKNATCVDSNPPDADGRIVLMNGHCMRLKIGNEADALLSEDGSSDQSHSKKSSLRRFRSLGDLVKALDCRQDSE